MEERAHAPWATRRAALELAGAGLVATACSASPGSGDDPTSSVTTVAADPDRVALDRAVALSEDLLAQTQDTVSSADPGGHLAALHRVHLAVLERALGATSSPSASATEAPGPSGGRRGSAATLRRHEGAAQRELAALALAASSGAVARLLASMSAGIAAALTTGSRVGLAAPSEPA